MLHSLNGRCCIKGGDNHGAIIRHINDIIVPWGQSTPAEHSNDRGHLVLVDCDSVFTARTYARAVLGVVILSVCLSVCPSVTRVHCDKTE